MPENTQEHPTQRLTGPTDHQPELTGPTPEQHLLTGPSRWHADTARTSLPPDRLRKQAPDKKPSDKGGRGRLWRIALIALIVFGVLFVIGVLPRLHRRPQLNKDAKAQKNTTPGRFGRGCPISTAV